MSTDELLTALDVQIKNYCNIVKAKMAATASVGDIGLLGGKTVDEITTTLMRSVTDHVTKYDQNVHNLTADILSGCDQTYVADQSIIKLGNYDVGMSFWDDPVSLPADVGSANINQMVTTDLTQVAAFTDTSGRVFILQAGTDGETNRLFIGYMRNKTTPVLTSIPYTPAGIPDNLFVARILHATANMCLVTLVDQDNTRSGYALIDTHRSMFPKNHTVTVYQEESFLHTDPTASSYPRRPLIHTYNGITKLLRLIDDPNQWGWDYIYSKGSDIQRTIVLSSPSILVNRTGVGFDVVFDYDALGCFYIEGTWMHATVRILLKDQSNVLQDGIADIPIKINLINNTLSSDYQKILVGINPTHTDWIIPTTNPLNAQSALVINGHLVSTSFDTLSETVVVAVDGVTRSCQLPTKGLFRHVINYGNTDIIVGTEVFTISQNTDTQFKSTSSYDLPGHSLLSISSNSAIRSSVVNETDQSYTKLHSARFTKDRLQGYQDITTTSVTGNVSVTVDLFATTCQNLIDILSEQLSMAPSIYSFEIVVPQRYFELPPFIHGIVLLNDAACHVIASIKDISTGEIDTDHPYGIMSVTDMDTFGDVIQDEQIVIRKIEDDYRICLIVPSTVVNTNGVKAILIQYDYDLTNGFKDGSSTTFNPATDQYGFINQPNYGLSLYRSSYDIDAGCKLVSANLEVHIDDTIQKASDRILLSKSSTLEDTLHIRHDVPALFRGIYTVLPATALPMTATDKLFVVVENGKLAYKVSSTYIDGLYLGTRDTVRKTIGIDRNRVSTIAEPYAIPAFDGLPTDRVYIEGWTV